jgi:hypothetical protein
VRERARLELDEIRITARPPELSGRGGIISGAASETVRLAAARASLSFNATIMTKAPELRS